jgi:uridylate kinase
MKKITRAIIKITGESFGNDVDSVNFDNFDKVAKKLIDITNNSKVQLAVVVGGGNIFRGRQANANVDSVEADRMGMIATVINGIGLKEALVRSKVKNIKLMSAFEIANIVELYNQEAGKTHLDNDGILIICGGLGKPGFTTDSAVAYYAEQLDCQLILKASTVDGIYDKDPNKYNDAIRFRSISFDEALKKELKVMDATAFSLCQNSKIPIFVFKSEDIDQIPDLLINNNFSFGTLVESRPENSEVKEAALNSVFFQ